MISQRQAHQGRSIAEWAQLLFGILGAPLAWAFHSLSIVLLVPSACDAGSSWPHWVSTGVVTAVALAALLVSWRTWRQRSHGQAPEAEERSSTADSSRAGFLTWGGMFISTMFLLLILIESLPLATLGACEPHP